MLIVPNLDEHEPIPELDKSSIIAPAFSPLFITKKTGLWKETPQQANS